MKKSFLNNLVGMEVMDAKAAVLAEGHIPYTVPEECSAVASIARMNTVVLWQRDGKIFSADPGDPFELKDDKWLE